MSPLTVYSMPRADESLLMTVSTARSADIWAVSTTAALGMTVERG